MVKAVNASNLEYLVEECFTESCGEVVDKTSDTEVVIAYDNLICVEYLTNFESHLSFLKGTCQILYADNRCTDTNIYTSIELG